MKLVRGQCAPLIVEWTGGDEDGEPVRDATPLVWDRKKIEASPPKRVEDGRCANDAADCALYGHRTARNYLAREPDAPLPDPFSEAFVADIWKRRGEQQRQEEEEGAW